MAKDRLIVKNFGPIKEVDINLAKVTVFIGEQASGKSVLAKLAALLSNPMASEEKGSILNVISPLLRDFNIGNFLDKQSYAIFQDDKFAFGFEGNEGFRFSSDQKINELFASAENVLIDTLQEHAPLRKLLQGQDINDVNKLIQALPSLSLGIYADFFKLLFLRTIYIPTERNLISVLSKSLFNLLKNDVELPIFIKTFGSEFESARKSLKEIDILLLNLKYSFLEDTDQIILKNNKKINLTESSSGIQSIVPLVMVVEAAQNDKAKHLFIVEEPELNLYPTTQKALVEYLVEKCTHGDNRLIITTHSPYILTALNNCIQAKNVVNMHPESAEEVEKLVPSKYHLDYQDIAAYYVGDGTARSIMNEEFQMIDANQLDDVSEQLGSVFDKLLNLKYQDQD